MYNEHESTQSKRMRPSNLSLNLALGISTVTLRLLYVLSYAPQPPYQSAFRNPKLVLVEMLQAILYIYIYASHPSQTIVIIMRALWFENCYNTPAAVQWGRRQAKSIALFINRQTDEWPEAIRYYTVLEPFKLAMWCWVGVENIYWNSEFEWCNLICSQSINGISHIYTIYAFSISRCV